MNEIKHSSLVIASPSAMVRGVFLAAFALPAMALPVSEQGASGTTAADGDAPALTLVSWGGTYQDAQRIVFFEPFSRQSGVSYREDSYRGYMDEIRAAYAAGKPWDVLEVEFAELQQGCDEGLWVPIDWDRIASAGDLIPAARQPCGVGFIVWSMVMVFRPDALPRAPVSWADMWNVEELPGKRGFRNKAQWSLEIALMADGVPVTEVYDVLSTPQGVDRAFAKLDAIKPHIVWWTEGTTPVELLTKDEVVMMNGYNGTTLTARQQGAPIEINWNAVIYTVDFWVIHEGAAHKDAAYDFINFAMQPKTLARFMEYFPYGPANIQALPLIDEALRADLPTAPQNIRNGLPSNATFWNREGAALEARFEAWRDGG